MAIDLGAIIWTAIRALLKFILTASAGFILARRGLLDSQGSRALSQAVINVFLPSLIFSKIVVGLDNSLGKEIGVLLLTSLLYMAIGLVFGYVTRLVTRCPRGWESGILAAGAFSNWGDLPLVMLGTITQSAPFDGQRALDKSFAYISIYLFMQTVTMFGLRGTYLVERDFFKPIPDEETCRERDADASGVSFLGNLRQLGEKAIIKVRRRRPSHHSHSEQTEPVVLAPPLASFRAPALPEATEKRVKPRQRSFASSLNPSEALGLVRSGSPESLRLQPVTSGLLNHGDIHAHVDPQQITRFPSKRIDRAQTTSAITEEEPRGKASSTASTTGREQETRWQLLRPRVTRALWRFLSPPSVATLLAFVISMITPLKQLFTHLSASDPDIHIQVKIPDAPDGQPPLAFLIDTTNFIGNATVPCSLLILGYALSRLSIKRGEPIPALGSAIVLGILKLVVSPIIAIAWMQFLARTLVNPDDLVLRLVLVLPAATPTATSLMYITQIFATEGRESETQALGVVLLFQYALLGLTLTVTVVYTLNLIS